MGKTINLFAGSQAPAWEFGVGSSSFPSREATTAWMQEVEQRRSSCRELRYLGSQAELGNQRKMSTPREMP